jgi:hypothetical protein
MSDMSYPRPTAPAADHAHHDALLVAQFAAADLLEDGQQQEAQRLVATCGSCARLAADLRAVSSAVAWEPVPPRRRDFRIDPEQAERLQGNGLTRLMRRLSLPRSAALRPAAAGLLSLGLVFVVAGYAWPDGGSVSVDGEANVMPAAAEERAAPTMPPFEEILRSQGGAPADEIDVFATDLLADDAAPQLAQKSTAKRAAELKEGFDDYADTVVGAVPEAPAPESAISSEPGMEAAEALGSKLVSDEDLVAGEDLVSGEDLGNTASAVEATDVAEAPDDALDNVEAPVLAGSAADALGAVEATDGTGDGVAADAQDLRVAEVLPQIADDDGLPIESLLLLVGVGLALLGGLLLLLTWWARRASDPLLR